MSASSKPWVEERFGLAVPLILAALFVLYQGLFFHFRPYDVDNPWFLSFSYNEHVEHIDNDAFLRMEFPSGMDGLQYFGRLAGDGQAAVARLFGWQQRPMAVLSSSAVVAALGLWAWALRRMGHPAQLILTFLVVAGIAEPYVSAANRFRFEPLSFLLISAGLLLTTYNCVFLGTLLAGIALETQPSALLGLAPVVLLNLARHRFSAGLVARITAALAAAAALTLALHPALRQLLRSGASASSNVPTHVLAADHSGFIAYFLMPRHLPETLFLAVTPWVFLFRKRRLPHGTGWILWSAVMDAFLAVLSPHPNVIYTIFFYPLLLLIALLWFEKRQFTWIAAAFALSAAVQYAYLAHLNRGQGYRTDDVARVSILIGKGEEKLGMSDADVHIVGDYSLWYAHPYHFQGAGLNNAAFVPAADLVLCYRERPPGASQPLFMMDCDAILKLLPTNRLLATTTVRGNTVLLYTPHLLPEGVPAFGTAHKD